MKKILIVEDDENIIRMLKRRLKKVGYEILHASNGIEGLKIVETLSPDLVLMDMHLPVMDGYTTVRTLREKNYKGKIAALTASATNEDIPKAFKAGCNYFISKPITTEFEKLIEDILNEEEVS